MNICTTFKYIVEVGEMFVVEALFLDCLVDVVHVLFRYRKSFREPFLYCLCRLDLEYLLLEVRKDDHRCEYHKAVESPFTIIVCSNIAVPHRR